MKRFGYILCLLVIVGLFGGCNTPQGNPLGLFSQQPSQTQAVTATPQSNDPIQNETMTLYLAHGKKDGVYSGEIRSGVPHGQGSFTTTNDAGTQWTYQGAWVDGHMSGYGETVWEGGWSERGTYVDDYLVQGESYFKGTLRYSGQYDNDQFHGQGTTYDMAGNVLFEGEFRNGYLVENEEDLITRADSIAPIAGVPTDADYNLSISDPDAYYGEWVMVTGTVVYKWEQDPLDPAYAECIVAPDGDAYYPFDVFYRYGWNEPTIEEGEWVTCYGIFAGTYTYTGEDGNEYTIPVVQAHAVFHEEYYQ